MEHDHLFVMANRIGDFFEAMADRQEALRGIADHLHKYWVPQMRRELFEQIDRDGASGLKPIVAEAIRLHRAELA